MCLCVEDDALKVERLGWGEEEIEVFECFCEEEAFHVVLLLFGRDILQRSVSRLCPAILDEVVKERRAHA